MLPSQDTAPTAPGRQSSLVTVSSQEFSCACDRRACDAMPSRRHSARTTVTARGGGHAPRASNPKLKVLAGGGTGGSGGGGGVLLSHLLHALPRRLERPRRIGGGHRWRVSVLLGPGGAEQDGAGRRGRIERGVQASMSARRNRWSKRRWRRGRPSGSPRRGGGEAPSQNVAVPLPLLWRLRTGGAGSTGGRP